jgi:hypothetical protein
MIDLDRFSGYSMRTDSLPIDTTRILPETRTRQCESQDEKTDHPHQSQPSGSPVSGGRRRFEQFVAGRFGVSGPTGTGASQSPALGRTRNAMAIRQGCRFGGKGMFTVTNQISRVTALSS